MISGVAVPANVERWNIYLGVTRMVAGFNKFTVNVKL